MADEKIVSLPKRKKPSENTLKVVGSYGGCAHRRFEINEKLAEVTCSDCKEKLNPMWVLTVLAQEDERLRESWALMRAEIRMIGTRLRFKCRGCGQFTRISPNCNTEDLRKEAERIRQEETL